MARIAFVIQPEAGHLAPTVRVAAFLREQGHRITYLAFAPFSDWLGDLGFERVLLPGAADRASAEDVWAVPTTGRTIVKQTKDEIGASGWADLIVDHLKRLDPDLVLCDETIAVRGRVSLAPQINRPVLTLSVTLPEREVGENAELVLCPAEFDAPNEGGLQPRRYYCEPSIWRGASRDARWTASNGGRRLVYCSFGTQGANYEHAVTVLRTIIAAFDGLEHVALVVAASALYPQIADDPRPDNVAILPSVPQLDLLSHADLVISQGGIGTLKEAIVARVPILVVPFLYDQPMNSRRVEHHGLGRSLAPADCTPETIREMVLSLLDDQQARERLSAMRAIFQAHEEARPAAQLILRALSGAPL